MIRCRLAFCFYLLTAIVTVGAIVMLIAALF